MPVGPINKGKLHGRQDGVVEEEKNVATGQDKGGLALGMGQGQLQQ